MEKQSLSLPAVILAMGLALGAGILGYQFKNLRQNGVITVKGLAEENFQSDSAEWKTGLGIWYPTYAQAVDGLRASLPTLQRFLESQGFSKEEIRISSPRINTHYDERYDDGHYRQVANGFDAYQDVIVNTKDLQKLERAHQEILQLRANNSGIRFDSPQYLLGDLENIKRSLIVKATEDARQRAHEFAKNSNSKVGAMRSASQGSFNILADNISSNDDDSYGGEYDKSTVGKRVRLVVTIQYGIE
ncbi:MAG: SIMPL domain-containing protein [Neisseriaceae bacterium]|nr:SIMPL domain-containing protein [Neisseriaceae bacterium]